MQDSESPEKIYEEARGVLSSPLQPCVDVLSTAVK